MTDIVERLRLFVPHCEDPNVTLRSNRFSRSLYFRSH